MLTAEELDELVIAEVGQTALFGARFRENAARALLIPRRRPGERTPLWQQRLKGQGLLQVARKYASFPIVLETYRECLQDVFDLPALKQVLHGLRTRELDLVDVESASASPFASSLLFDYIATYMYEDDTPPAERRAQALSLDRDLLPGLPDAFLEGGPDSLRQLVQRYARGRGPFTTASVNAWFGVDVEPHLRELEREDKLVRGELRPGGSEREWCDPDVLRRLRRASLAALRKEVEPVERQALARFLPSWHGIDRRATLREALVPLQALSLPVALWEAEVLPRRVPRYRPEMLDQLCASGEVVWVGAGLDRVAVFFREDAPVLGAPA